MPRCASGYAGLDKRPEFIIALKDLVSPVMFNSDDGFVLLI